MKRIHKVKTAVIVKDTISDEKIEILRDNGNNLRDRAMIDFLLSNDCVMTTYRHTIEEAL